MTLQKIPSEIFCLSKRTRAMRERQPVWETILEAIGAVAVLAFWIWFGIRSFGGG